MALEAENVATQDVSTATDNVSQKPWQFTKGNPGGPGRPKKGTSVLDRTRQLAERKAKKVAEAHVNRMLREDATGNRAWAEYRDTFYGMPKQTLVLEQGDSPLLALYQQFNAIDAGETVDVRELPPGE